MSHELIARLTSEDFDRARMEILRDLAGIEPGRDASSDPRAQRNEVRKDKTGVWSTLLGRSG